MCRPADVLVSTEAVVTKTLIACAAVSLLALWGLVNFYNSTAHATEAGVDVYKVGDQPARFQDLMAALPPTVDVGYISDVPLSQPLSDIMRASLQYTLAPRLLSYQHAEWVIGNFSKPLDVAQFGVQHGLTLVKDFGNGAVLYRNQAR
jgi:hypothetical protein